MVPLYGEGEIRMVDKLLETMREEQRDLKKSNRKEERDKNKRIKARMERLTMDEDISAWKVITKVKQTIAEQLESNPLTKPYTIKNIAAFPDYFEYQHPDAKQSKKKSNIKQVDWIKEFIAGGGTEQQLMDAAAESRVKVWRRIAWKRPKKETTSTAAPEQPRNKVGAGGVGR